MPEDRKPDLDGWEPVLCESEGMPQLFFEYRLPNSEGNKNSGSIALFEKNGSWYVRKDSSEHIADGVPYCEARKKVFENFDIRAPDPEKIVMYGVRVCG